MDNRKTAVLTKEQSTQMERMADSMTGASSLLSPQPRTAVVQPPAPDRPTTIDGLIAWAKWHPCPSGRTDGKRHNHSLCEAGQLIIDTLDVALPCGVETPTATADGLVTIPDVGGSWSVEDAHGIAAAILRAAEAAEKAQAPSGR